jgi:hypothetical protein
MAPVRENSRGIVTAALIVIANFAIVLQVTGISYGRFQWAAFGGAYDTPTATPTTTPTETPTPVPNGGECTDDAQCASTFCVDGVCCDTPCDQPRQVCDLPGRVGTCTVSAAAPAPALGGWGLAAAVALLLAIAALALHGARRWDRGAH